MKIQPREARTIHVRLLMFVFPIACSSLRGLVFVLIHSEMQTPMPALSGRGILLVKTHKVTGEVEKKGPAGICFLRELITIN
jgi:hypothetical protein